MKRATILIVATAVVLSIAFGGIALASQPVCPTPETESIKTVTKISCQGRVTETEQVRWESSNENLINNPPLAVREVVGKMDYYQDLKVTDGVTNFIKDMDVDTGSVPNLNVMKSMGYSQGTTIGSLSHTEDVSFGVVANFAPTEEVILCPFAAAAVHKLPASCEDVKASSSMVVTDVLATTVSKVGISESPLDFHYEIDATGSGGAGAPAVGHITAEYEVYVEDGSAATGRHCGLGNVTNYTLGSKLTHYEKSTADGLWEFHKEMDYTSAISP
ncbi:MAG: hypothetical protein N2V75_05645 [Methanophagales archaeon]|nr:hypothetical protein [Methanophagales archaeon]